MKKVAILTDLSGLGNCSLMASLPVFSSAGHYVVPVVSGAFSAQTGFEGFRYVANDDIYNFVAHASAQTQLDAIYTGFLTSLEQLQAVKRAVSDFLPTGASLFVDPIMGDNGKLYPLYDGSYVASMKSLMAGADCIFPNITEACLLCDVDYEQLVAESDKPGYLAVVAKAFDGILDKLQVKSAVITGVEMPDMIANVVVEPTGVRFVTNDRCPIKYSGTGDVFASVLISTLLRGSSLVQATSLASSFVYNSILDTKWEDRRFGINFTNQLRKL